MLTLLFPTAAMAGVNVEGVRIWPAPDHTRLVLDVADKIGHKVFALSGPSRLVIDLENTTLKADFDKLDLSGSPVKRIRSAPRNGNDLRVVLDLKSDIKPRSFQLEPNQQYGHRLVVDLIDELARKLQGNEGAPRTLAARHASGNQTIKQQKTVVQKITPAANYVSGCIMLMLDQKRRELGPLRIT
jgi:N-acetylmuramoyl-L-alanine amidase